jgi:ABC-type Fe3+/spermidine/putrescine transport system ATPase subunit
MSVSDNIGFGLKVRRVDAAELKRRVGEALDLVQLAGLGGRKPHELSGGQRQRVALARAIVTRPRVLLLDEPLSALDKALRVEMQVELKRIQREVGITTIFVTHDQEEALTMSDQIGILKNGRLVQSGPPRDLYHRPLDRFTASFLGEANFFSGTPEAAGLRLGDETLLPWPRGTAEPGVSDFAVRPEEMTVSTRREDSDPGRCLIHGELRNVIFSGPTAVCVVSHGGQPCKILVKNSELGRIPAAGPVSVSWPADRSMMLGP